MRLRGTIRSWKDDKGFGFIEPGDDSGDVFMHISSLQNRSRRPEVGQVVSYTLGQDKQGRPRANRVLLPGDKALKPQPKSRSPRAAMLTAALFLGAIAAAACFDIIPRYVIWWYLGASAVAYLFYAGDKSAAKKGEWRTGEDVLHLVSLLGGWPGAMVAQQTLRHKSSKTSFRAVFWITVFINVAVLLWFTLPLFRVLVL